MSGGDATDDQIILKWGLLLQNSFLKNFEHKDVKLQAT